MSKRRRVDFGDITPAPANECGTAVISALRFVIITRKGEEVVWDFTALPGTPLVRGLVAGLELWLRSKRFLTRRNMQVTNWATTFANILTALHDAGVTHLHALDPDTHDRVVEEMLFATLPDSGARRGLQTLHQALGQLDEGELHPGLATRLQYQSLRSRPLSTPRDAYSGRERREIRKACVRDMEAIVRRLDVKATALLARGSDPRTLRPDGKARRSGKCRPLSTSLYQAEVADRTVGKLRAAVERLVADPPARISLSQAGLAAAAGVAEVTAARYPEVMEEYRTRMLAAHPGRCETYAPRTFWGSIPHLAWEMNERGPMSKEQLSARSGGGGAWVKNQLGPASLAIFPTADDLLPFQLYLQLMAGLPPDACYHLSTDCLRPTGPGLANLTYYKGRANRPIVEGVATGTLATVGGAVKMALVVTERLRRHAPKRLQGDLWLRVNPAAWGTVLGNSAPQPPRLDTFVRRHGLTHDDGSPLRLVPAKLRKSHKANVLEATQGNIDAIASDHSRGVAAKHYGNIPALRPMHEATIEDAAQDALDAAMRVTVVSPDEEALALAGTGAPNIPLTPRASRVLRVLQHPKEHDVFLAGCMGFLDSPFAKTKGEPCPVATWRCLECDNAVVLQRHLPRLLAFFDHLLSERDLLDAEVWRLKYGRAHEQITTEILPCFPERAVDEARALSRVDLLTWLPPELRTSRLTSHSTSVKEGS